MKHPLDKLNFVPNRCVCPSTIMIIVNDIILLLLLLHVVLIHSRLAGADLALPPPRPAGADLF